MSHSVVPCFSPSSHPSQPPSGLVNQLVVSAYPLLSSAPCTPCIIHSPDQHTLLFPLAPSGAIQIQMLTQPQLANVVVFLFSLGSNVYSVAGPDDMYASSKETYLTPAPMAFWVWSLIHLLLLGTMFFQFTARGKEIVIDSIGWRFAILGVFNTVYIYFWSRHWYILAFVLSL